MDGIKVVVVDEITANQAAEDYLIEFYGLFKFGSYVAALYHEPSKVVPMLDRVIRERGLLENEVSDFYTGRLVPETTNQYDYNTGDKTIWVRK